jgi:hypothetical protein
MAEDTGAAEKATVPAIEQPVAPLVIPALSIAAKALQKIADDLLLILPTNGTP